MEAYLFVLGLLIVFAGMVWMMTMDVLEPDEEDN